MLYHEDYIKALLKNNEKFINEYYKLPSSQEILLSIEEAMDKKNKGMELDKIYDH